MRMRLWRRRLTISAPRMAIRSAIPWPLKWLLAAVVLGFSASVALWAFEFGREIAGLDRHSTQEVSVLREDLARAKADLAHAEAVANSSDSLMTAERAAQQQLAARLTQLEDENRSLRRDLALFEQLIPAGSADTVAIRGMQAERLSSAELKWQVLLMQSSKAPPKFVGEVEVTLNGTLKGKPWTLSESGKRHPVSMGAYIRLDDSITVPAEVVVKTATVRLMQGNSQKASQTVRVSGVS